MARLARVTVAAALALTACKHHHDASPPAPLIDAGTGKGAQVGAPSSAAGTGHDVLGDALPAGAIARLGSLRMLDRGLESMVYAPDGKELVSSSVKGAAIWDAASGQKLAVLDQPDPAPPIALAADGKLLATVSSKGDIQLWDLPARKPVRAFAQGKEVLAMCFTDGDLLVAVSAGEIHVWLSKDGSDARAITGTPAEPSALGCHGRRVLVGDDAGTVLTLDLASHDPPAELGHLGQRITAAAPSPDGKRLAVGLANGEVKIWYANSPGKPLGFEAHDRTLASLAWSATGDVLWTSGGDAWLRSWDPEHGTLLKEMEANQGLTLQYLALAPDGQHAATWALHRGAKGSEAGRFWLWQLATGDPLAEPERHTAALTALEFSPDGTLVATASDDQTVRLWKVPGGEPAGVFTGHEGSVNALRFSRDGKRIYSAGEDANLLAWSYGADPASAEASARLLPPIGGEVNAFALLPDESRAVTGDETGRVWSWDLAAKAKLVPLDRQIYASITGVALSPDGRLLAISGSERTVQVIDLGSGADAAKLQPDDVSNFAVGFSPDGKLLAAAGDDGKVRLWTTATWKLARTLEGHDGSARCLGFSPDGARLVSGGNDGTVRLWQVASGKPLGQLVGHDGAVTAVSFSPDGKLVGSASQDRTALLWKAP